jgi:class 3 adenylate cyclase
MREKVRDINSKTAKSSNALPRGMMPRRLAAIVAGDIVGYSRLMELDEEGTHSRVKRIQRDLIEPSITEHYGRLVKTRVMASLQFLTALSKRCAVPS